MEPRRGVVTPELERWSRDADDGDRRTALVRLRGGAEVGQAAERLTSLGMEVTSTGPGSVIGAVSPPALRRIARETWVLAVEGPRTLRSLQHD
ncbi:hypothetical protein [Saccharothrix luteola]|uniref:hypothetical protein n=1 Tax=Saccharothrix luteola TaxID=2893018 RepID=UPI001E4F62C6|nr:hypothetical protein [Saccharothrix luteola]MCC8243178.1 hypothetical protein [Saccharothrix luteola]